MRVLASTILGILLFFSIGTANALKTILLKYSQLVVAVENGDTVIAIIHFDNCLLKTTALRTQLIRTLDGASTRFNFTRYLHARIRVNEELRDTVTTTMTNNVEQPSGELWQLYGRLSVYEDNTADLHVEYYNPITHKRQLAIDWECIISNGNDNNGLVLFDGP